MKTLKHIALLVALVAVGAVEPALAQTQSSSSVVRMRKASEKDSKESESQVTQRMKSFYDESETSDADLDWMKVVYRSIDLTREQNMALYYPEEPNQDGMNLFFIIMRLIASGELSAYEYLDGKELFTDEYRIKVNETLDRFGIYYSQAKGSTEKNPKYTIEDSDVPANEVLSYYVIERWEFDRVKSKMCQRIEAICPVLHRSDYYGGEPMRYPMFWVKLDDTLRPYLAKQSVFTDNDNNLPRYNYDDFFQMALYKGDIYKTKNLRNLSLMQMYPDPDDLKRAQDSIEARLRSFDANLWVPTREELQAQAEAAAAAAAAQDSTAASIASRETTTKSSTRSSRRGSKTSSSSSSDSSSSSSSSSNSSSKKSKSSTVKETKVTSGSASRSVRRRR